MGDAIGAGIVYHLSKAELDELDRKEAAKHQPGADHDNKNSEISEQDNVHIKVT